MRKEDRKDFKRCRGATHLPGGEVLHLSHFLVHKSGPRAGKPFSLCKQCLYWQDKQFRLGRTRRQKPIAVAPFLPLFQELARRIGANEACRRAGYERERFSNILKGKQDFVRPQTISDLEKVLEDARAKGEDNFDGKAVRMANMYHGTWSERRLRKFQNQCKAHRIANTKFQLWEVWRWLRFEIHVPLDLVPHDYWWPRGMDVPLYGEEVLGDDF